MADLRAPADKLANSLWSDRELGPVLRPRQEERGERAARLCTRRNAEEHAEEARVFHVAATRARDRLIVAGEPRPKKGVAGWAWRDQDGAMPMTEELSGVEKVPLPRAVAGLARPDRGGGRGARSALVAPLPGPAFQNTRSATELMARERSRAEHRLR